ncbi:MAG: type II toxin-antitoxin system Phd/YefM family antitoxin [Parvularculaceae bacterium]
MRSFSAKQAKQNFGAFLDAARAGPVGVLKHGRLACVLVSAADFHEYEVLKYANVKSRIIRRLGEALDKYDRGEDAVADRMLATVPGLMRRN